MLAKHYKLQSLSVLATLPVKTQHAIEYLRTKKLAALIKTPAAHVSNNVHTPIEYWTAFPAINVKLHYYEEYAPNGEIIIIGIEHPIQNRNGHSYRP